MELAKVQINRMIASTLDCHHIPKDIVGAKVLFSYTDSLWDGLTKNVVFEGSKTVSILNAGEEVYLPPEVVADVGVRVRVGVCGVNEDGSMIIPTLWAELGIVRDAVPVDLGEEVSDPVPPIWAQLQAQMGNLTALGTVAAEPGQTIRVEAVDENGIPTKWKALTPQELVKATAVLYDTAQDLTEEQKEQARKNVGVPAQLVFTVNGESGDVTTPQSDWNQNDETAREYIKNRTHWYDPKAKTFLIENTRTTSSWVEMGDIRLYLATTLEVFNNVQDGAEYVFAMNGVEYQGYTATKVTSTDGNGVLFESQVEGNPELSMVYDGSYYVLTIDPIGMDRVTQDEDGYYAIVSLYTVVEKYHKMPKEYLYEPDWAQNDETAADFVKNRTHYEYSVVETTTVTFDGDITGAEIVGPFIKISDRTPSVDDVIGGSVSFFNNGETTSIEITSDMVEVLGTSGLTIEDSLILVAWEDSGDVTAGIWTTSSSDDGVRVAYVSEFSWTAPVSKVQQLDEKYIPSSVPVIQSAAVGQTIMVKSVDENGKPTEWEIVDPNVLASSTEGSTKKFKITVDDSGTLTATEVT